MVGRKGCGYRTLLYYIEIIDKGPAKGLKKFKNAWNWGMIHLLDDFMILYTRRWKLRRSL